MQSKQKYYFFLNAFLGILFFLLEQEPLFSQYPAGKEDVLLKNDFNSRDSLIDTTVIARQYVRFSKDSLSAPIDASCKDSMILDNKNKKLYLFGDAVVNYEKVELKAGYIELDWDNNLILAKGTGLRESNPTFKEGEQEISAFELRYNFKTQKGKVFQSTSQQNDIVIHSEQAKFIRTTGPDTTQNDVLFSVNSIFTTCTADHPHFGIRSTKQKIIPNKLIIVGPSRLEIMDIPTPVWLPFGFFPINPQSKSSTGLLFPRDYEYSPQWGYGLRDIGWFFPINDYYNLALRGNIYFRGTWGVSASSDYRKRYKYSGSLNLAFDSRKTENLQTGIFSPQNSVQIRWSHRQESGAHPTNRFGGSVNIQTNGFQNRVFNDAASVLQTQLNSNMSFDKNYTDKPYNWSVSFNHTQNLLNKEITINFPDFRFQTQSVNPFKRKIASGAEKWYEAIVMRYRNEVRNSFSATDTTLFSTKTLSDAKFGVNQAVEASTSFKILRFFNLNPNANYREVWQMQQLRKDFDPTPTIRRDTIYNETKTSYQVISDTTQYGRVNTDTIPGFASYRTFDMGFGLNTRLFSTLQLKSGFLRGLRHEVRPTISFNYSPDYIRPFYDTILTDTRYADRYQVYTPFEQSIYGSPPQSGKQMAIGYSLNNILLAKIAPKKDSTLKTINIIDNLVVTGNYNFAADSLRWSPVFVSTTARFFKGATTASFSMIYDPYMKNARNERINTFWWKETGRPLRLDQANLRISTNLTVGKIRALFQGKPEAVVTDVRNTRPAQDSPSSIGIQQNRGTKLPQDNATEEDFLSLFENFSISHNIDFTWREENGAIRFLVETNSINCRGDIKLTPNWAISVGNFGYDFVREGLSYPSFGFIRDLHCWDMSFNWQPQRGTYSFMLRVKPGTLDFLKIPYQRNNGDTLRAF